jgi:phosphate-selective porin OprO/OprP
MHPMQKRALAGALATGLILGAQSATAQEDVTDIKKQLDDLDQKIRVLQRLQEIDKEAAAAKTKESPTVSAGRDGFYIRSGDNAYSLRLGGNIQFDTRWYPEKTTPIGGTTDQFIMRKVRPVIEGVFYDKIAFRIMPDFGQGSTVLQDAYIEYRHSKAVNIRAGKYKPPIGLERLQADAETEFVERSLPTNLVPNRDIGIQWGGSVLRDTLSFQAGVFNGNIDNSTADTDLNDQKDYLARIFAEPFRNGEGFLKGLGVGISYGYGVQQGAATPATLANLPTYRTVGQQTFFSYLGGAFADGERQRVSPQFYYYNGPFGLLGEYVASEQVITRSTNVQREVGSDAWQLMGMWVITGEDASFRNPTPRRPYAIGGPGWGAVELVVRYAEQSIDDDAFAGTAGTRLANPSASAREARNPGIGVNWYFSRNFKIQVNYDETSFTGGAADGGDRPDEKAIFTRFQANF